MRTIILAGIALFVGGGGESAFAQRPQTTAAADPVETVIEQADAAYAEAMKAATQAYAQTRKDELAKWVAAQEKALASANSAGDQEGVDFLTEMIGRSKRAGFVVEPLPQDAVKLGGNDYALIMDAAPWHVAKRQCERMGGHLVTIETAEEEAFVAQKFGKSPFWIGASDAEEEGTFVWLSGRLYQSFDVETKLDNWRDSEHAIQWNTRRRPACWDDGNETAPLPYVCEWER